MTVAKQVGFGLEMLKKPEGRDRRARAAGPEILRDRRPRRPQAGQPVGRPAPARGAGARHDHRAAHPAARRADRRARLFAARDRDAGAEAAAAAHRHLLHLGDARPERGLLAGRPGRGHEPCADRAAGPAGGDPAAPGDRLRRELRAGQQRLPRPGQRRPATACSGSRRRSASSSCRALADPPPMLGSAGVLLGARRADHRRARRTPSSTGCRRCARRSSISAPFAGTSSSGPMARS